MYHLKNISVAVKGRNKFMQKEIGYIGLGKMGYNMSERLLERGWKLHVFNRSFEKAQELENKGAQAYKDISDLVQALPSSRLIWVMVPHTAVDAVLEDIIPHLEEGDYVIDGGNSPYKDSMRRAQEVAAMNIHYLDVGVSGGPDGARNGACMMIGGQQSDYEYCKELFEDTCAENAYGYMGNHGAGHFVKMVHNGIEYGMMQAIAEGFSVLRESEFNIDGLEVARVYNKRSVIESRLMEWMHTAFAENGLELNGIDDTAIGTGEGKWTIEAAHELGIPVRVIEEAFNARKFSEQNPNYQAQIIMALRNQFGGHDASKK